MYGRQSLSRISRRSSEQPRAVSSLQLLRRGILERRRGTYTRSARLLVRILFMAAAHTCPYTISADSIGLGRECRVVMPHPQISERAASAFRAPFAITRTLTARKLGLNARRGNFSAISRTRVRGFTIRKTLQDFSPSVKKIRR